MPEHEVSQAPPPNSNPGAGPKTASMHRGFASQGRNLCHELAGWKGGTNGARGPFNGALVTTADAISNKDLKPGEGYCPRKQGGRGPENTLQAGLLRE